MSPEQKGIEHCWSSLFLPQPYKDEERRQLTIARLWRVERLNGGALITPEERENAERAFIRHYMNSEVRPRRWVRKEIRLRVSVMTGCGLDTPFVWRNKVEEKMWCLYLLCWKLFIYSIYMCIWDLCIVLKDYLSNIVLYTYRKNYD